MKRSRLLLTLLAVLAVACTRATVPTTSQQVSTTSTEMTSTTTVSPSTTSTIPDVTVDWSSISASPWLIADFGGIKTSGGEVVWEAAVNLGELMISRDGEGGFVWVDAEGLWWLPLGEPAPDLVRSDVQRLVRAVPTPGGPAALVWTTDAEPSPIWIDLETGEIEEPETPGIIMLDDPYLTQVWFSANGLAAVVTAPSVLLDAEGQPTQVTLPARLIVSSQDIILTEDSEGNLEINLEGPHFFDIAVSTLESPWARLHDFDGQRIIVSRGPFEPALPEESFLFIDLACGSCYTEFRAAAAWATLNGIDEDAIPVLDRQPSQLLSRWPGTDEDIADLDDGVYLGFLDPERTKTTEVTFDLAFWFSGLDADRAASHDGSNEIPVPNDFYIRNLSDRFFSYPVSADIEATSVWYDYESDPDLENVPLAFPDLVAALTAPDDDVRSNLRRSPWWIVIEQGQITRIDEQYTP